MKILFVLPHYYQQMENGFYGSLKTPGQRRRMMLVNSLFSLHQLFGQRQALMCSGLGLLPANDRFRGMIDVLVVTTGERHLLEGLPKHLFTHVKTPPMQNPLYLGFICHELMRERVEHYDFFCFLEDDIVIRDPLFFKKLEWFQKLAGPDSLLQPNRFELRLDQAVQKLYPDGNLRDPNLSGRFQDITEDPVIEAEHLGEPIRFERVDNPHAGCFFLSQEQMRAWMAEPHFAERTDVFIGPLECAATLSVMRTFKMYKPSRENAGFLEVLHGDNRYLGVRINPGTI